MLIWKKSNNLITHGCVLGIASPGYVQLTHLSRLQDNPCSSSFWPNWWNQAVLVVTTKKKGARHTQEQKGRPWEVVSEIEGINHGAPNEWKEQLLKNCVYLWGFIQSRRGTCNIKWTQKYEVLLRHNTRPSCLGPNGSTRSDLFATGKWWAVTLGTTNQWPAEPDFIKSPFKAGLKRSINTVQESWSVCPKLNLFR